MSPSLRLAPRLRSLVKAGLVESYWPYRDGRRVYYITASGLDRNRVTYRRR
jgi:DNA-binding PadR family transcriptional regulator